MEEEHSLKEMGSGGVEEEEEDQHQMPNAQYKFFGLEPRPIYWM